MPLPHILAVTRFNRKTSLENDLWRQQNAYSGCIYGSPVRIKETILIDQPIFVLEMQNDENRIKGIGLIRNQVLLKQYNIYPEEGNYNRYIYKSAFRLDRTALNPAEEKIIAMFDVLLFKGARHMKRGQGITEVSKWIVQNKHVDFIKYFKAIFFNHFSLSLNQ